MIGGTSTNGGYDHMIALLRRGLLCRLAPKAGRSLVITPAGWRALGVDLRRQERVA